MTSSSQRLPQKLLECELVANERWRPFHSPPDDIATNFRRLQAHSPDGGTFDGRDIRRSPSTADRYAAARGRIMTSNVGLITAMHQCRCHRTLRCDGDNGAPWMNSLLTVATSTERPAL